MNQIIETVIIGGGQAGLATGYGLKQFGREAIILEQASQPANAWRNDRWDSFALLTPNWAFRLPGAEYQGNQPDGFMPREEIVATFEQYIDRFQLPVQYQTRVNSVTALPDGQGYRVTTGAEVYQARNVVVATGLFQRPKIPIYGTEISARITQLHSGQYRNPASLAPGAVLVVGSGQSGCQIAEELYQNGRRVYLCTGSAGRAPRRYRGKDVYEWLYLSGFLDRTVDKLPSPRTKFAANPQVSGRDGGHSLNLHQFARDGVVLLGHMQTASAATVHLEADLKENLGKADKFEQEIVNMVDGYITKNSLTAPHEELPMLRDGYAAAEITELNLSSAGISTVIWAIGYRFDFDFVQLPVFDGDGYPIQQRGVTDAPGLFFVGLPWLHKQKSGLLIGVGEDAEYIAWKIATRSG
jgi:putative flavoprotein involved in K+ transport